MRSFLIGVLAMAVIAPAALAGPKGHAAPRVKTQRIAGWVSCEHCGAAKAADASHAACAKQCVTGGSPAIFVSDKGHHLYKVDNQDALKDHVGEHVNVTASVSGDTIHVDKLAVLKQKPAKGAHS